MKPCTGCITTNSEKKIRQMLSDFGLTVGDLYTMLLHEHISKACYWTLGLSHDDKSISSMHVVYSFRQQLSTYIHISLYVQDLFCCHRCYFYFFSFSASGGFILNVMFAAAFVHILYSVAFVRPFVIVKYKCF